MISNVNTEQDHVMFNFLMKRDSSVKPECQLFCCQRFSFCLEYVLLPQAGDQYLYTIKKSVQNTLREG
jgi:hypothetical protein